MRLILLGSLLLAAGSTLVLSELRPFRRVALVERLAPSVVTGRHAVSGRSGLLSAESFREVIGPLARALGGHVAHLFGVHEGLELRLARVHARSDATAFRVRQLGWAVAAFGGGGALTVAVRPPAPAAVFVVLGAPLLAFLVLEQQLASASARWQRQLTLELPVVSEQLAMLLCAGFSLTAALNRLAHRGCGPCARDLALVCARLGHGVGESAALAEWAARARVPALDRLVPVLALHRQAGDLGRLVSDEARAIRRDLHRELVETMERRGQQVWVPVTVATLLPGVIFLAIPFIEALRAFSGS